MIRTASLGVGAYDSPSDRSAVGGSRSITRSVARTVTGDEAVAPRYSTRRLGSSAAPVILSVDVAVSWLPISDHTPASENQFSGSARRRPLSLVSPRKYV